MASFKKYATKNKGELWMFKADVGTDPQTGRRQTTTRRGFKTKREAQDAAREFENHREDGTLAIERQGVTVQEFLTEWLEVFKKGTVRDSTFEIHKNSVFTHIVPALGFCKLKDLSPAYYQRAINELAAGHLSRRSVQLVHVTMSHAMKKAVELEIIRKNPCAGAKIPNRNPGVRVDRRLVGNYLTREEIPRFLEAAKTIQWRFYLSFKMMIYLGFRKGETYALWPEDVDFEAGTVRVDRTLHFDTYDLDKMFGPPKTESSYRTVLAPASLMAELKKQVRLRKETVFALQSEYRSETNLLICRGDGNPLAKSTLRRAFKSALKKAGINRNVTIHGLRHTHAVMMLESGASLKEVQERLGHKTIDITANVYSHITERIERRSMENFIAYMAGE